LTIFAIEAYKLAGALLSGGAFDRRNMAGLENAMKKMIMIHVAILIAALFAFSQPAIAQEEASGQTMTQGDLALIFAQKLGLAPGLPTDAGKAEAMNALAQIGYAPRGGWNADSEVTLGDLAVILAAVLKLTPENPEDDASVVEACVAAGVDFSSVASALISAEILSADPQFTATGRQLNDPLFRLPPGAPWQYFSSAGGGGGVVPRRGPPGPTPVPPPGPAPGPVPPFVPPSPPPLTPN
jgi:hypothetical protein